MNILKNSDVADDFNVSNTTVSRWIDYAKENKNNLQTVFYRGKDRILDNPHNRAEMLRLAEEGKKYRSGITCKRVSVSQKMYELFNTDQIVDIFNDLDFKRELKIKYSYKDGGATYWDQYYWTGVSQIRTATSELIFNSINSILYFLDKNKKVNIVDIGPGNGHPAKDIIQKLIDVDIFNKYIQIDISKEIIDITKSNITGWFPNVEQSSYEMDIEFARFGKVFLENKHPSDTTSNIILHIGNTMSNHDDRIQVLKNFRNGMLKDDILIITFTLNNEKNKSNLNSVKTAEADLQDTWPLGEIGFDLDKCEIDVKYDDKTKSNIKTIRLDKDYIIECNIFDETRQYSFNSGEYINIWKHYLIDEKDFVEEIDSSNLKLLELKLDKTMRNAIVICKAK